MSEQLAIAFFVPGEPVAAPRMRARAYLVTDEQKRYIRDKMGRPVPRAMVYDPGTADMWKGAVAREAKRYRPPEPFEGPIHCRLEFRIQRPKSHFRTGRFAALLLPDAPPWPASKPDADNYEKAVLDALTGIMWGDDGQVCKVETIKFFSSSPGVLIELEPLGMSEEGAEDATEEQTELALEIQ
jgi:Holliday junction resolvase RusA-like endonuclease